MSHLLCQANALRIPLANESVQCCVTSPPYWGLRDYGVAGQLGLEATPDEFVAKMVAVFREIKRVLRSNGTLWINMGDSYNAYNGGAGPSSLISNGAATAERPALSTGYGLRTKSLKPKDLVGIPWRLAFALQADGWYLRSDIIWAKPNPMPESVTDRPTKSHEYLFLLSKSERYYFDAEAVREEHTDSNQGRRGALEYHGTSNGEIKEADGPWAVQTERRGLQGVGTTSGGWSPAGRNIRTVWTIPTESYPGSHFATYPRKLVEPCIKAGTSEKECCPECGKGWVREVNKPRPPDEVFTNRNAPTDEMINSGFRRNGVMRGGGQKLDNWCKANPPTTTGWRPSCSHDAPSVPCVVLDPFSGSGTTGVVANALGRSYVGLDLSAEYIELAKKRIARPHAPIQRPGKAEYHPLFGDQP